MKKKSILRAVLTAVLSLVATIATAHDFEVDGIYYNDNCDGTVSVTYKGSSYNEYTNEYTGDVTIPSSVTYSGTTYSVTSIGEDAFWGCSGLTSVNIPNSVTSIGDYTFYKCSGLTSVTIPNSVTSIGNSVFLYCSGLTSVTIPNSVTSIGKYAFYGCSGLTSVTIPNSVTSIGNYAFQGCSGLKSVTIPNSVTSIGNWAFSGCRGLKSIFYNAENCADIKNYSYVFNYGTNIIFGKDVKKVPDYLFYSLYRPTSVISKSATPPSCGENTFNSSAYPVKLYVPSGAIADYKAAKVWKKFTKIEGIETNDAENVAD